MSDNTHIEWTDATANVVNGCSLASPGCTNCYAMRLAGTRLRHHPSRAGLTQDSKAGPVWTGEVRFNERALMDVLRWTRPRRIFWNAHGDLFHPSVPDEWIDRCFAVMALTPHHTHQVLTKRSARMREYIAGLQRHEIGPWRRLADANPKGSLPISFNDVERTFGVKPKFSYDRETPAWALPNVWLGVSVEDQTRADERIPDLLATPAAVRWLSCEPLLGPVDLRWIAEPDDEKDGVIDALLGCNWIERDRGEEFRPARPGHQDRVMHRWVCSPVSDILANRKLDWVVVGGESGPGARPMHPDWARSLRDQCAAAGVPFLFKQWGEWAPMPEWEPWDRKRQCAIRLDGSRMPHEDWFDDGQRFKLAGKKAAGRLLDRVQHDEYPA